MAGIGYQIHSNTRMNPNSCRVRKSLNFADDSGIESEFEAGLDDVNTSIKSTPKIQDESGQSGRYDYFLRETTLNRHFSGIGLVRSIF